MLEANAVPPESILLVDDRLANLMVYRSILEDMGQVLVSASSGEEALKLVLKQDFAVILLDVNMPTLNGFDTAALIRKRRKSAATPIIFLTAFTDEVNIIQGYASGAVDFMPTPVIPAVLRAKVKVFIELSQMRRQAAMQAEERARREAAEEAARHEAFLAKVSEHLARAHTREDFITSLVHLPVPHLADAALVWFKRDSQPDHIEWASAEDSFVATPAILDRIEPTVTRVLMENRPALFADAIGGAMAYAQLLPLTVQGQAQGVLVLGTRQMTTAISPAAVEVAYRASVVLENVMLMDRIREADRRKDEFLGMLAHELRNPLGPVFNCLQLQKMLPPGDTRLRSIQETMERQVKHMSRLIDDLLDATRLAHGKILLRVERCDLGRIVRQTAEDYRSLIDASGIRLDLVLPDDEVWVDGDPTRLQQVVGNLLHNAHKFSNSAGVITLRIDIVDGMARVSVADTGVGIDPAMLDQVFDVFRQADQGLDRSRGGLGLGLALVKGLVQLHHGAVEVFSEGLNRGAEFRVHVPLSLSNAPSQKAADGTATAVRPLRILLIEDNADAAESARMLLDQHGHQVAVANNARDGLAKARDFVPDVILCDIGLPEIDGYQVIQELRHDPNLARIYVIALTGYGRDSDRERALRSGFDLHLTKPIDWPILAGVLRDAGRRIGRRRPLNA